MKTTFQSTGEAHLLAASGQRLMARQLEYALRGWLSRAAAILARGARTGDLPG